MINPAEKYRQELEEEMYMEHYESGPSDLHKLLREEHKRVKKELPLVHQMLEQDKRLERRAIDLIEATAWETAEIKKLSLRTEELERVKKPETLVETLKAELEDLFREYQDLAGIHIQECVLKDKRIEELEHVLRTTKWRLTQMNRATTAIDGVLDKKGD